MDKIEKIFVSFVNMKDGKHYTHLINNNKKDINKIYNDIFDEDISDTFWEDIQKYIPMGLTRYDPDHTDLEVSRFI